MVSGIDKSHVVGLDGDRAHAADLRVDLLAKPAEHGDIERSEIAVAGLGLVAAGGDDLATAAGVGKLGQHMLLLDAVASFTGIVGVLSERGAPRSGLHAIESTVFVEGIEDGLATGLWNARIAG